MPFKHINTNYLSNTSPKLLLPVSDANLINELPLSRTQGQGNSQSC